MTNSKLFLSLLVAGAVATGTAGAQSLKDAKEAIQAEQYDEAKSMLQNLVEKRAKKGENYFYLGQIHLVNDKVDSAQIVFQEGLTNDPKEKLNTVGLGVVDLQKGDAAAAEQKFAEATDGIRKRDYELLYYAGRGYIDAPTPDYQKAVEYLTRAKEMNAKDPLIPTALGDAYAGLRESSPAFVAYRDALAIDENLLAPKIGQAIISRRAQAYDVVLEQLTALAEENPEYGPIYRELAETYYLSSLKAPEDQYREINQKALENYQKYLSITGDQSIDAKVRYADFLVYSGNYEELKKVASELANEEGVDAKVHRYLGYIAFLQDKDYAKSLEHMNTLFSEVDTARLIGRDYLYLGLANVIAGDATKGTEQLKVAVQKETEEEDLDEEIAETAFSKFQEGETEVAAKIFAIPATNPESGYYYDANYYKGQIEYGIGSRLVTLPEGVEPTPDVIAEKMAEAKPHLEVAVEALNVAANAQDSAKAKQYQIPALYFKGLSELALDNVMYDPENSTGLFVDSFTKLLTAINASPNKGDEANVTYAADAHNYLGYYAYLQGNNEEAKQHFTETLSLKPDDPFAQQMAEAL
ncbi:MAG TPA: tetratricopeptide repeat protein [Candidatus Sphingobacterium stercorigallinarum]|nr:tetratricopeptide repeat protein [Candidatus Sphingobacterium stercorigallinarum]